MKSSFTKAEDDLIAKNCKKYQKNLQWGFEVTANTLGMKPKSIENRWYKKVRYSHENTFITTSGKQHLGNTKVIQRRKPRPDRIFKGNLSNIIFRF